MNALRIRKRLDAPVPGFPELSPLVGKTVEIIVLSDSDAESQRSPTSQALQARPVTQRARVTGRVEAFDSTGGGFSLRLDTGDLLRARWAGASPSPASEWNGLWAVVDGSAAFSEADTLLDLGADTISRAREADGFFSQVPKLVGRRRQTDSELHQLQTPTVGMAQAFGAWPGNESDEEVLRALEEVE